MGEKNARRAEKCDRHVYAPRLNGLKLQDGTPKQWVCSKCGSKAAWTVVRPYLIGVAQAQGVAGVAQGVQA